MASLSVAPAPVGSSLSASFGAVASALLAGVQDRAPLLTSASVTDAVAASSSTPALHVSQSALLRSNGLAVSAVMAMSLMRMLSAGPEVSLKGSPTVSATTQALPIGDFLMDSFSQSFFALSQAPPAFAMAMAKVQPETMEPARAPMRHLGPTRKPIVSGARMANMAGAIISWIAAFVASATQRSLSGITSSSAGILSPAEARRMASSNVTPRPFDTSLN
mmetsp:Transcript_89309/g.207840  ORF Transcript_89309/g.207840 Transcript_89309/m.207840 type:complete len:220 (-) Transcript_89309:1628-2287(-)